MKEEGDTERSLSPEPRTWGVPSQPHSVCIRLTIHPSLRTPEPGPASGARDDRPRRPPRCGARSQPALRPRRGGRGGPGSSAARGPEGARRLGGPAARPLPAAPALPQGPAPPPSSARDAPGARAAATAEAVPPFPPAPGRGSGGGGRCEKKGPRLLRPERGTPARGGRRIHLVPPRRRRRRLPRARGSFRLARLLAPSRPRADSPEPAPAARSLAPRPPPRPRAAARRRRSRAAAREKRAPGDVAAEAATWSPGAAPAGSLAERWKTRAENGWRRARGPFSGGPTRERRAAASSRQPSPSPPTHAPPHHRLLLGPSPQIYDS